jgi:adenine-specific DNA glycosylase
MKKTLLVALMMAAGIAQAGSPRCAGSYEPAKCEAFEAKLAAETPEQRKAAAQKLEADRVAAMKEAHNQIDCCSLTSQRTIGGPTNYDKPPEGSALLKPLKFIFAMEVKLGNELIYNNPYLNK